MMSYMNTRILVQLNPSADQAARLQELQGAFTQVCNALAPIVQETRCWNRVGLHHLAYRAMRERFPQLGSQMVCNAIYSVSRACRLVLQHPNSPLNIARHPGKPLPLLHFLPNSPVYFDRHTLSIKDGKLSMFTLDGRMRFHLDLTAENQARFHAEKLREIVLSRSPLGFQLAFSFSPEEEAEVGAGLGLPNAAAVPAAMAAELPEYLLVSAPGNAAQLTGQAAPSALPS